MYEERVINGCLHRRHTKNGIWVLVPHRVLTQEFLEMQSILNRNGLGTTAPPKKKDRGRLSLQGERKLMSIALVLLDIAVETNRRREVVRMCRRNLDRMRSVLFDDKNPGSEYSEYSEEFIQQIIQLVESPENGKRRSFVAIGKMFGMAGKSIFTIYCGEAYRRRRNSELHRLRSELDADDLSAGTRRSIGHGNSPDQRRVLGEAQRQDGNTVPRLAGGNDSPEHQLGASPKVPGS